MVLSGGVSQNVNPYQYALDNTTYADYLAQVPTGVGYPDWIGQQQMLAYQWNTQNPAPAFDVGVSYQQPPQTAYSVPVQSYSAPTLPVSTGGGVPVGDNIAVDYSPVQVSNYSQNIEPTPFPNMPGFTPQEAPGFMNIGGRNYGADQLIAANPQQSFAPGVPQMDTVSDGAYGSSDYQSPSTLNTGAGQDYVFNGNPEAMPPAPSPVPQMPPVSAVRPLPPSPNYMQSPAAQAIPAIVDYATQHQADGGVRPNVDDFMPSPDRYIPPMQRQHKSLLGKVLAPAAQGIWAMRGPANDRANAAAAGYARYDKEDQRAVTLMQTLGPTAISAYKEVISQEGADRRLAQTHEHQQNMAKLNFALDQEDKKILSTEKALELVANANLLPAYVNAPTGRVFPDGVPEYQQVMNPQKAQMLAAANRFLGMDATAMQQLQMVQDPRLSEQYSQAAIDTKKKRFELRAAKEKLSQELDLLQAQVAQAKASAAATSAGASAQQFELQQKQAIAKALRESQLAQSMQEVEKALTLKGTRQARIDAATLANEQTMAETFKKQMEANTIPTEAAARLAAAMAQLANNPDPSVSRIGLDMTDATFGALGIENKHINAGTRTQPKWLEQPVQVPAPIQQFRQNMPQQPRYRQRQTEPIPERYFTGQPLAGNFGVVPDFNAGNQ